MTYRKSTKEFREQALALAESCGSVVQAAAQLGIPAGSIYAWRAAKSEPKPQGPSLSLAEAEELERLRKEVTQLRKANQILKAAAAFFSQDSLK